MTNSTNILEMELDYAIALSPKQIDRAVELSDPIPEQASQWQTYLNALALFGFEQWLEQRAGEFVLEREQCSVFHPEIANAIAACHLKVNQFQLCLIAVGSLSDEEVVLPRAVVDLPEFIPHFYVLIEVQEEPEIAVIGGFLSYQQLISRQEKVRLQAEEDWTYEIPIIWFDREPDRLLLFLRCLQQEAIPLPIVANERLAALSKIQKQLATRLPQMRSPEYQLWQVLTWEEGVAVLTSPDLLKWVYDLQRQAVKVQNLALLQHHLSDLLQLLTQPIVNTGRWLRDELDEIAQKSSWMLLPSLVPSAMRSPTEAFKIIAAQLRQSGEEIPGHARGACLNVSLAGLPLHVYVIVWQLLSELTPQSWTLLLVLSVPSAMTLPCSLTFRVSDKTGVLAEQMLTPEQGPQYLFTRVIGGWEERFIATISLINGIELSLPPFGFAPEE